MEGEGKVLWGKGKGGGGEGGRGAGKKEGRKGLLKDGKVK